ncbi:MAG: septal ring lytic transglycosylase RlpA family protein [Geobacteraceae bacterium]|nr:septal ring lytic transglycosylase RlpA family protein [Geobacteraceae bacterium]
MIKRLLILSLLMPGAVHAAHPIERDDLSDAQLLEVLAKDGDNLKDPQIGVATYYASRFTGRRTTSGQRYHPDKMTAAHALLPLGTMVTVENVKSGQKVSVVINDRCHPRHAVRNLIDLSRAAAQQIGLWGKGAVKVRIVPLEKKHPLDELLDEGKG